MNKGRFVVIEGLEGAGDGAGALSADRECAGWTIEFASESGGGGGVFQPLRDGLWADEPGWEDGRGCHE